MLEVRDDKASAFEELVTRYQGRLVRLLGHLVGSREQAEDLSQEVFLRVYRARKTYPPGAKFATWVFTIANNVASHALREYGFITFLRFPIEARYLLWTVLEIAIHDDNPFARGVLKASHDGIMLPEIA